MSNFRQFDEYGNPANNINNNYNKQTYREHLRGNNFFVYSDDIIGIGIWVAIFFGIAVPIVNIIVILGLAFGSRNENLKNYGRAMLIFMGINVLLALLVK